MVSTTEGATFSPSGVLTLAAPSPVRALAEVREVLTWLAAPEESAA